MNDLPLSIADLVALGIIFLSGFLAYFRGALREFFFLATWGGAVAATVYLYSYTLPFVTEWVGGDPLISALANAAGLFVLALTAMTLISMVVVKRTEDSKLNVLDRSLGFVFGLVRGVLIVCLIYLLYTLMAPIEEHPQWLQEAKLTPAVAEGAEVMLALVPEDWGLHGNRVAQQLKDTSSTLDELGVDYNDLIDPQPGAGETGNPPEDGYNEGDRSALDEMIGAEE
ncbi:MAG: CvpA family protein [Rhodospirillales bacterium]|nr:CvpA family protein [Rhodospirillales bacterium]